MVPMDPGGLVGSRKRVHTVFLIFSMSVTLSMLVNKQLATGFQPYCRGDGAELEETNDIEPLPTESQLVPKQKSVAVLLSIEI